jgi:DNA-binding transcriptional ArsR family regulator
MTRGSSGITIVKDPEVAKLFADETRRRILHMLRHQELSGSDLAKALDRNPSSIQHHLSLLKDAGLVEVTREEKVRNMIQPFYRATAHSFIISYSLSDSLARDDGYSQWRGDLNRRMFEGLETLGIRVSEEKRPAIMELIGRCYEMERRAFEEVVEQQEDPGKLDRDVERSLIRIMAHIKLSKDEEHQAAITDLYNLLGP